MGGLAGGQSVRPEGLFASSAGMEATPPQPFSPSQADRETGGRAEEEQLKAPRSNLAVSSSVVSSWGHPLGSRGRGMRQRERGWWGLYGSP